MILSAVLDRLAAWRDRREVQRQQLQAAENFVCVWAGVVGPDSHEYGAELGCAETNTLASLFRLFHFWSTANQLQEEHERGPNCNGVEQHPEIVKDNA
ncbi:hypothetical protein [Streptomyces sp. MMS24-I29]|uniref:hypothetical protein n=1 Tax=Streptomyces sp. MMS24-I29 TaxID=3351480 RepID=UPI003C7E2DA4